MEYRFDLFAHGVQIFCSPVRKKKDLLFETGIVKAAHTHCARMDVSTELALRLGFGPLRGDTINLELTNFFLLGSH
jgi:hypothetical protein